MNSLRYDSLRKRLALPFGLLGLVVSAVLSALTYWIVTDIEQHATERVLQTEMESFRNRRELNPQALPPATSLIHGVFLPSSEYPTLAPTASAPGRFQDLTLDERDYIVLVEDVGGRPYALLYDRTVRETGLADLAWVLAVGTVLMGGLSALVGIVLTGQVVRPIRRLVTDIAEKSSTIDARAGAPVSFSAADYPSNEIGQLVRALDQFALRLHRFMQRESHFAADVSHELRTPIAVIRGAAEVLVENREFTEPVRERLRTIHRQAVRMGGLLEAMLLLARENEPGGDPACALAEVVEEALADCTARAAPGSVAVALEIRERPIVPAEHSLAYVVISNLLRNAFAHTREGSITVRLTADRIEIIDTGIGIPEHRFPEIFERLVKGEESDGSGLGLSIVARITEMLGWQIGIESRSGAGTQVNVRFAAAPAAAAG